MYHLEANTPSGVRILLSLWLIISREQNLDLRSDDKNRIPVAFK